MLTAMNKLLYETQGVTYLADKHSTAFYAGRMEDALSANLREMEADYGIIPYPLQDETQEEYSGIIHNSSNYVTIPVTCPNADEIGAVIEALCAESYRTVIEPVL